MTTTKEQITERAKIRHNLAEIKKDIQKKRKEITRLKDEISIFLTLKQIEESKLKQIQYNMKPL